MIGDRAMFTKDNMVTLLEKKISLLGPACASERGYILSVPHNLFTPLLYATSKDKGGYTGVEIECYSFTHQGKDYRIQILVVNNEDLFRLRPKTLTRQLEQSNIRKLLNSRKFKDKKYVTEPARRSAPSDKHQS